jgi:MFS family permease
MGPVGEPVVGSGPVVPGGATLGRREERELLQLASVAMGTLRCLVGFMTFLVAFGFRRAHAPAWWFGIVLALSVGGNLAGAALSPRLRGRVPERRIITGALLFVAVTGATLQASPAFHRWPQAALLGAAVGFAAGAAKVAFDSLVQQVTPKLEQGKAFARFEAIFQLVWVLGALVPVLIPLSLRAGYVIAALMTITAAVAYEVGAYLARHGRLPSWWPVPGESRRAARARKAAPAAEEATAGP